MTRLGTGIGVTTTELPNLVTVQSRPVPKVAKVTSAATLLITQYATPGVALLIHQAPITSEPAVTEVAEGRSVSVAMCFKCNRNSALAAPRAKRSIDFQAKYN